MPLDKAQSSAARSAPVCPPETIFGMFVSMAETLPRTGFVVECAQGVELSQGKNCSGRRRQYVANLKGTDLLPTIRLLSLRAIAH
jgi:hypothetical protein